MVDFTIRVAKTKQVMGIAFLRVLLWLFKVLVTDWLRHWCKLNLYLVRINFCYYNFLFVLKAFNSKYR